jgi:hypothetical protein
MEPQVSDQTVQSPLKRVTPLSKWLAMVLFILMPFIGGWIGYTHAPIEIVETYTLATRITSESEAQSTAGESSSGSDDEVSTPEYVGVSPRVNYIPPESLVGTIEGLIDEDGIRYIEFDEMKFYRRGGSCWGGPAGYCIVDDTQSVLKFELESNARLTRSIGGREEEPCTDLLNSTYVPDIQKDALDVETVCSGTIATSTMFYNTQYYWLIFTERGTVSHIVEQYVP